MKISYKKFIVRQDLRSNPKVGFLFGDNLVQKGFGGQAKEMRGEPNAIGIPTKKRPDNRKDSFFTDQEFRQNVEAINKALQRCYDFEEIVIPSDGLGTGLAMLDVKAPKTYMWLKYALEQLK